MQGSQVPVCRRALLSLLFGESDFIRAIAWQRTDLLAEGYQKEDPRCSKLYVTVFKKQGTKGRSSKLETQAGMPARRDSFLFLTFNLFPRVTCQGTAFTSHSSSPAPRSLASSVLGETPSFSAARVLFHLHSRMVFSSKTFSTWFAARPVTSSSEPSQLKFSASIPAGRCSVSGFEKGSCKPSA